MLVAQGSTLIGNVQFGLDGAQLKEFPSIQAVPKNRPFLHPQLLSQHQHSELKQSSVEVSESFRHAFEYCR